jgi:fumarate reductase subunit C
MPSRWWHICSLYQKLDVRTATDVDTSSYAVMLIVVIFGQIVVNVGYNCL